MLIDIVFFILMVLAVIKGYQKGLIIAVFSIIAFIIGIAAAMKLSTIAASYIGEAVKVSDRWLPVISFIVVFILVVILVRLGAKLIEKTFEAVQLGWLNRLGGIILYAVLYTIIVSIIIFYAEKVNILNQETIESSVTYSFIQPWGPKVIDGFGAIIPLFRDMFSDLEDFFGNVSRKSP